MRWHFAGFCLDSDRRELRRQGESVRIEPQAFDLLEYLVTKRDRLVTRDDLIADVWGGRLVSESALATCINAVRDAVGDTGERQALIRTIPRKGLRFVGEVREEAAPAAWAAALQPDAPPLPPSDRPSIAVLPFDNLGGDPAQDYFADGVVEGIITGLCHHRWLFVIARNSSFAYKGRQVAAPQVGRELGVRYILGGSFQRAGDRVRIGAQLVEAASGAHLWADRFDRVLEDVFALQDDVAAAVVGALAPRLESAEIARARRKPTDNLDAYDLVLRGMAEHRRWTREGVTEALRLFTAAIALDDGFANAHSLASICYHERAASGWMADRKAEVAEALRLSARAVDLARDDAAILARAGSALAMMGPSIEAGSDMIEEALAIDPNLAFAWLGRGWVKVYCGESDAAIESFGKAMRLSPLDQHIFRSQAGVGAAHLLAGRLEEARLWAERASRAAPLYGPPLRVATAALALAGREEEARRMLATLRASDPDLRVANLRDRAPWRPNAFAVLAKGLRLAGLPE
jgi:TolB-like protein